MYQICCLLNLQTNFISVHEQSNDHVMPTHRFGQAARLAGSTFDPRSPCEMFPVDLLGVRFPYFMLRVVERSVVCPPIIRIQPSNAKRGQELLALSENRSGRRASDIGEHGTSLMIDGMPEPTLRLHMCLLKPPSVGDGYGFSPEQWAGASNPVIDPKRTGDGASWDRYRHA